MKKNKGFTLIELLAVLVILAIISLITIPIVINVVQDSKESSYKNSIVAYGKAVENAMAVKNMNHLQIYNKISDYARENLIETSGNIVICNDDIINDDDEIQLNCCRVVDSKDYNRVLSRVYTYKGKKLKSVDPSSCGITIQNYQANDDNHNDDSSSNNSLNQSYSKGQLIEVNSEQYYVIKNSSDTQEYVVALKKDPLSLDEVNRYGEIYNENDSSSSHMAVVDKNGYGAVAYYLLSRCNRIYDDDNNDCKAKYEESDIKKLVNNWAKEKFSNEELATDNDGYQARLITIDEYHDLRDYAWKHNQYAEYWTMTQFADSYAMWIVGYGNYGGTEAVNSTAGLVRPVVNIKKSSNIIVISQ